MNVDTNPPTQAIGSITLNGSWNDARECPLCGPTTSVNLRFSYGYGPAPTQTSPTTGSTAASGNHSFVINPTTKDALFSYWFSAQEYRNDCSCLYGSFINGSLLSQKTYADTPTFNTPTNGTPTQKSCPSCAVTFNPKTNESVAEIRIQYKKTADSVWIDGPILSSGEQGDFNRSVSTTLSNLDPGTSYDFRFRLERTTENDRVTFSATKTFSTNPAQTITTNAASGIGVNGATLNGNVNPQHANNSVTYYFEWGLTTAYGNVTATQGPSSGVGGVPFLQALGGLLQNTTYHYRAVAKTAELTVNGNDVAFTTNAGAPTATKNLTETITMSDTAQETLIPVHDPVYFNVTHHADLIFNDE